MAYIGNTPAEAFSAFQKQDFSTSATTSYTLDHPVANANEIALFINFVRQEPTAAYTASGTSLTLTSATSSSDDMYCVYLGKAIQTVNPPNSSVGTSQLDSSLDFSSKTITLASNMKNTPAFSVIMSADQTGVGDNTETKVNFDTEEYDTNSSYDVSNKRFTVPSGADGKYQFSACVTMGGTNAFVNNVKLYKNGSAIRWSRGNFAGSAAMDDIAINLVCTLDLSANDYIEIYAFSNVDSGTVTFFSDISGNERSYFCGNKLIG